MNILNEYFKYMAKEYFKWGAIILGLWALVYFSCNYYASTLDIGDQYHMYMEWETGIPVFSPMIIVYTILYGIIFLVVPFVMNTPKMIRSISYSMIVSIIVAGAVFILFPGHLGFERPSFVYGYQFLFGLLYSIDSPHNLFPSLHIAFASLFVASFIGLISNVVVRMALIIWFILICASVVLVHQHHLFDILTGLLLGLITYKFVFLKMIKD